MTKADSSSMRHYTMEQLTFFLNSSRTSPLTSARTALLPPIAIPNPETYPSGSPENPISIVDDSEDQFIEVSETAIQTSPTSSQSANHEHGSADQDTQVLPFGQHTIRISPRPVICILCGDIGHNQFTCPYPSD
ncbi:hypothetical protein EW145_g5478 [Phellinidium pouzarii]|uniref:Uncharacterized protein n=1 Tax=Phellinidium pouzarii TaxID=167371 RepID=A0A4S4KZV6_9AGAM|nr:hypothetical protein EW145_g5478 [Phellinidium pouzarii]